MDYSLLMAIRKVGNEKLEKSETKKMDFEEPIADLRMDTEENDEDPFAEQQKTFHKSRASGADPFNKEPIYSRDGKWCYQISIIDYLQTFDSGKKNEVLAKKIFKRADPTKLSAVPPDPYGNRFKSFMKNCVFKRSEKYLAKEREEE